MEILEDTLEVTRPIVRYHGGKFLLAPWILSHFPKHRVYVEPFGGAASVLLLKERSYGEVYNDLDAELVNLFTVVRNKGSVLQEKLRLTPFSRLEYQKSFRRSKNPIEQARRTVVRSLMGFGSNALCREIKSGFRANSNKSGTTPAHDFANYPDALDAIMQRLRGVVIESHDALKIMRQHDSEETLHYCDPPYVHSSRSQKAHGHHGYTHEMTDEQHFEFLYGVNAMTGMVIISGYKNGVYSEALQNWAHLTCPSFADGARPRTEVLWFNALAWEKHEHEHMTLFNRNGDRPDIRQ